MSAVKIKINRCWLFTYSINKASKKGEKKKQKFEYSYLAHGSSQQHLRTCSFMPACLRCRALVDTKVLLYVLCCFVQRRLKAVLLCLWYVDTMVFRAWFVLLGLRKKSRFKSKSFVVCLCSLEAILAEPMMQLAVSKKSTSPAVMFTSRLVLPSAMTWTEKSACFANLPHLHKHTRARFLLLAVVMLLLYCRWFWCCYEVLQLPIALSSLLINERKKERHKKQRLSLIHI